jgi:RNase adaptor protein for sRNA GlmZ degradation
MIQSRSKDTRRKKPVKKAETIPHSLRREKSSTRRIKKKMGKGNDAVVSKEFF